MNNQNNWYQSNYAGLEISEDGKNFIVFTPYNRNNVMLLRSCPGRRFKKGRGGHDVVPVTKHNIEKMNELAEINPTINISQEAQDIIDNGLPEKDIEDDIFEF